MSTSLYVLICTDFHMFLLFFPCVTQAKRGLKKAASSVDSVKKNKKLQDDGVTELTEFEISQYQVMPTNTFVLLFFSSRRSFLLIPHIYPQICIFLTKLTGLYYCCHYNNNLFYN